MAPGTSSSGKAKRPSGADEPVGGSAPLAVREDESPWTAEEIDEVRSHLLTDRARLEEEMATTEEGIAALLRDGADSAGNDQADIGSTSLERDAEMSLMANAREMVFQIDHALERTADGTYGVCESCGNAIGKHRLMAFPRATLCVTCKQREERR